jgi:hypothetical protein
MFNTDHVPLESIAFVYDVMDDSSVVEAVFMGYNNEPAGSSLLNPIAWMIILNAMLMSTSSLMSHVALYLGGVTTTRDFIAIIEKEVVIQLSSFDNV